MLKMFFEYIYDSYYIGKSEILYLNIKNTVVFFSVAFLFCAFLVSIGTIIYGKLRKENILVRNIIWLSAVIFFSLLSFCVNLIINYKTIYPVTGSMSVVSLGFPGRTFNRVYREEWLRGIVEIVTYVPIGICLCKIFKNKIVVKTMSISVFISLVIEYICNKMSISRFYYLTLINNFIGVLIGIGLFYFVICIYIKDKKQKIKSILLQLPLLFAFLVYGISYLVYFRHDFGNVYPDYYKTINMNKIQVSIDENVDLSEYEFNNIGNISYSIDDLRDCADYIFSLYDKKIDDLKSIELTNKNKKQLGVNKIIWTDADEMLRFVVGDTGFDFEVMNLSENKLYHEFVFSENEAKKMLEDYGILLDDSVKSMIEQDSYIHGFTSLTEFYDGVYSVDNIIIECDDNGNVSGLLFITAFYVEINTDRKEYSNPEKYYEIISPQQAYEKLCAGEGYSEGLVEAADKGNLDIHVTDYHVEVHRDDLDCLQYVYCFNVESIEVEGQAPITKIYVPAMKINY